MHRSHHTRWNDYEVYVEAEAEDQRRAERQEARERFEPLPNTPQEKEDTTCKESSEDDKSCPGGA